LSSFSGGLQEREMVRSARVISSMYEGERAATDLSIQLRVLDNGRELE